MDVSRQEASEALDAIGSASRRVQEVKRYREASPYLIVWGLVWLVANAVTDLQPRYSGMAWLGGLIAGAAVTITLIIRQALHVRRVHAYTAAERTVIGRRWAMLGFALMAFFPAMITVLSPLSMQQHNAFVSLFWAFAYMASGAWLGMRMFVTGIVTAAAVLVGYLLLREHYFLWMAITGGGSLLLGGLWLRKV